MTKAELVEEVARAAELNKRDAEVIVETVFDSIIGALHKGEKVELRGFGSFRTRERGPRRGRNPKTGEPVDVPAKRVPYFKPGKELKEYFTEEPGDKNGEGDDLTEQTSAPAGESFGEAQRGEAQPAGGEGGSGAGSPGETAPAGSAGASDNAFNSSSPAEPARTSNDSTGTPRDDDF